ncbi:hypothetical protein [Marinobacterium weihaiense]|uniref:Transmembrane protein n=1 Tax=Marinobacterium weihaiense TaxID=2851016 RepID=A0ABS6MF96_9GAMM|nr:hypothetical protein [Marinobacterium weihaiense]MBV0934900.1 hypothetical protein [Marinobacterium weihaiense]
MIVQTEEELAEALEKEEDTIEIEGDLKRKVLRIKATGKVAWIIAVGAIGAAVVAVLYPVPEPTTQFATKGLALTAASGSIAILGFSTTVAAISIAVSAGGVGVLNTLRAYRIAANSESKLVLKRN